MKVVSLQNQVKKKPIGAKSPTVTQQPYHTVVVGSTQPNHDDSSQTSTNSQHLPTSKKQHSSSQDQSGISNLVVLRTDLNGSGNLNASLKIQGQAKTSTKSVQRSTPGGHVKESPSISASAQIPHKQRRKSSVQ